MVPVCQQKETPISRFLWRYLYINHEWSEVIFGRNYPPKSSKWRAWAVSGKWNGLFVSRWPSAREKSQTNNTLKHPGEYHCFGDVIGPKRMSASSERGPSALGSVRSVWHSRTGPPVDKIGRHIFPSGWANRCQGNQDDPFRDKLYWTVKKRINTEVITQSVSRELYYVLNY